MEFSPPKTKLNLIENVLEKTFIILTVKIQIKICLY